MADTSHLRGAQDEKVGFGTSMLGFNKKQVLEYIDRLSASAQQAEQQHAQQTAQLQSTLDSLQSENNRALDELRKSVMILRDERQRTQKAQEELQAAQERLEEEKKSAGDFKKRLFERDQEVVVLRRENTQLSQALAFKMAEMEQLQQHSEEGESQAQQELEQARAQAADILEQARRQAQQIQQQALRAQLPHPPQPAPEQPAAAKPDALQTMEQIEQRLKTAQLQLDAATAQLRRSAKMAAGVLDSARGDLHSLEHQLAAAPLPQAGRPVHRCALADRLLETVNRMLDQKPASACKKP